MMFAMGSNPTFTLHQATPEDDVEVDYDTPGYVAKVPPGAKFDVLGKMVIDPSIREGFDLAEKKGSESMIYKQALGEPLGANAPFSMVALLSQAGRLPLVPYQRMASWTLADAMYKGMMILREETGKRAAVGDKGVIEFEVKDIPETFELNCELDIAMPQDERQNVTVAMQAAQGDNPLMSMRNARERWLQIEQPDEEQEEIWTEQMAQTQFETRRMMATAQAELEIEKQRMAMEQGVAAQQPGGQPGQAPPMPGQPAQGAEQAGAMPQFPSVPPPGQPMPEALNNIPGLGQGVPTGEGGVPPEAGMGIPGLSVPGQAGAGIPGLPMASPIPTGPEVGGEGVMPIPPIKSGMRKR
jgi:hypothetical protein